MNCDIVKVETPSSIELVGKVSSSEPAEGSYHFVIEKQGPSGRSDITQSGDFLIGAGDGEEEVGRVTLDMDPSAFYVAHLVIEWSGGEIDCRYDSRN